MGAVLKPSPCPFCGQVLKPTRTGFRHLTPKEGAPRCYLGGFDMGSQRVHAWEQRHEPAPTVAPVCYYEVPDGLPTFNELGQGKPATVKFLNQCFDYIRGQT